MAVPSVSCEARKTSYRQTKDGLVVSFVVHPNDMPDALAIAPLGTRYMLALVEIGDDEQPVPPTTRTTERRATDTATARQRYIELPPAKQAVARASLLPKDPQFRAWLAHRLHRPLSDVLEGDAAEYIRSVCNVMSRREIATDAEALKAFLAMELEYKIDTNQMATPR